MDGRRTEPYAGQQVYSPAFFFTFNFGRQREPEFDFMTKSGGAKYEESDVIKSKNGNIL